MRFIFFLLYFSDDCGYVSIRKIYFRQKKYWNGPGRGLDSKCKVQSMFIWIDETDQHRNIPQNVWIKCIRNAPTTLRWFRSELTPENIKIVHHERPEIECVSSVKNNQHFREGGDHDSRVAGIQGDDSFGGVIDPPRVSRSQRSIEDYEDSIPRKSTAVSNRKIVDPRSAYYTSIA